MEWGLEEGRKLAKWRRGGGIRVWKVPSRLELGRDAGRRETGTCQPSSVEEDGDKVECRKMGGLKQVKNIPVIIENANGTKGDQELL